jgi:hypothetical protein
MSGQLVPAGKTGVIKGISFALMAGFDSDGQPMYASGTVESAKERKLVQSILEPLRPAPHSVTAVTMGEVTIEMEDGHKIILRPVFHPSLDVYRDLFFVEEGQYPMPAKLAELLNRWRKDTQTMNAGMR